MSIKILAIKAVWSTLSHLLSRGSLIIASVILARNLDPTGFAAYSYFQLTVSMLAAYAAMGMGVTASKFFAECNHVDDQQMPPIGTLWILSIIIGLFLSLIFLCLPSSWIDSGLDVPKWLLSFGIFSMSLGVIPGGGILGLERYKEATFAAALSAIFLILGAFVAGRNDSPILAMAIFILTNLLQAVGNGIVLLRSVGLQRLQHHSRFGIVELRMITEFAGPMIGVSLLAASGSWIVGRMILSGPSGEYEFALYAIGLQWFSLALFLPGMVSRILYPRMVKAKFEATVSANEAAKKLVHQGGVLAVLSAIIISFIGFLISPWLLKFYGSSLQIDKWLLAAFMLAAIPSAPANTLGNAIVAHNGQRAWLFMTFGWFVCLLATAKFFSETGAWSGAISQGVSAFFLTALAFVSAKNKGYV